MRSCQLKLCSAVSEISFAVRRQKEVLTIAAGTGHYRRPAKTDKKPSFPHIYILLFPEINKREIFVEALQIFSVFVR